MRPGAHKIRTIFTAGGLTHFGGIYLLHPFLRQLHLRSYLHQHLSVPQRNNRYTTTELLFALIYPMILGLEKIEVAALLNTNGVFQYITGLPSFPNPTTLRRFLVRAAPTLLPQLHTVHNALRSILLQRPTTPSSFWMDCDSTATTLYGHQEGVVKGYNPNHQGKKSYHPLIVTEAHLGDCLAGLLRPGNAHTADRIEECIEQTLALLPHRSRLRLRADAGFYDGDFVQKLKKNSIQFAIVAKMTAPIKGLVAGKQYTRVNDQFSTSSFRYQPHGWQKEEQFVILRRRLPPPEEEGGQTTLFTLDRYAYSVIVTNLPLTPWGVFTFYKDRAAMERIVRTCKDDYPFGTAPTNHFEANVPKVRFWWTQRDSNPRPLPCHGSALPTEL